MGVCKRKPHDIERNSYMGMEKKLVEVFHWLHRHPELAMKEYKTTEYLRKILLDSGVRLLDTGLETGLIAMIGTGGGFDNHHPSFTADPSALLPTARFFAILTERELERLSRQFYQRSDE